MFLDKEFGIQVLQPIVSRLLKEHRLNQKRGQRVSTKQNKVLKEA